MSDLAAGLSDEQIAALHMWDERRQRRRVSLARLAPARDRSDLKVSATNGRWTARLAVGLTKITVQLTTKGRRRFAAMVHLSAADLAVRLSTYALARELGKRAESGTLAILADALAERGDPLGAALHEFSGRYAALRRDTSPTTHEQRAGSGTLASSQSGDLLGHPDRRATHGLLAGRLGSDGDGRIDDLGRRIHRSPRARVQRPSMRISQTSPGSDTHARRASSSSPMHLIRRWHGWPMRTKVVPGAGRSFTTAPTQGPARYSGNAPAPGGLAGHDHDDQHHHLAWVLGRPAARRVDPDQAPPDRARRG